jgi:protein TonB
VIRAPPPPPDQPPPPPPPEEEEPLDTPEPVDAPPEAAPSDQPPPGDSLGLDADGSGAGDGFGLVGRRGGRDLLAGGTGYSNYAGLIKNELLEALTDAAPIRKGSYTANLRLWIRRDGSIDRVQLLGSTGNATRDRQIEAALEQFTRFSQPPPADMPQPVSLRVVARS